MYLNILLRVPGAASSRSPLTSWDVFESIEDPLEKSAVRGPVSPSEGVHTPVDAADKVLQILRTATFKVDVQQVNLSNRSPTLSVQVVFRHNHVENHPSLRTFVDFLALLKVILDSSE